MWEKYIKKIGKGIKAGLPIAIGYFPVAIAFGLLSRGAQLTLIETLSLSFIVFAGASQFVAVGMFALGAGGVEIIMTTMFLNFRHFLMSASLVNRINYEHNWMKPIIAFFVTDESFSVASFTEGRLDGNYLLPMQIIAYLGWGIGSGIGYLAGSILPRILQESMNIGLYSLLIALLIPKIKNDNKLIILTVLSAVCNTFIRGIGIAQGWSVVISIVVISLLGVYIIDDQSDIDNHEKGDGTEEIGYD